MDWKTLRKSISSISTAGKNLIPQGGLNPMVRHFLHGSIEISSVSGGGKVEPQRRRGLDGVKKNLL